MEKIHELRTKKFTRNLELEDLLHSLADTMAVAEQYACKKNEAKEKPCYPVILVLGPHRSGTTLFMQWLAQSGIVAYPTNLLSRFYYAPIIGAHIQLLLTDERYNFRDEILDFNSPISFSSENGKTKGALAPNEFWYFWRRFFKFDRLDWMSDDDLMLKANHHDFVKELTALTQVFDKPFALKSMMLNYNIPFLRNVFKNAIFVQVKRDPLTNIASVLEARKRQLGSEEKWYSFKIPEYDELKDLSPEMQAAGQVYYINKAVDAGMEHIDEQHKLVVQYEDFCANPHEYLLLLKEKLDFFSPNIAYPNGEGKEFNPTRAKTVNPEIIDAYDFFAQRNKSEPYR